MHIKKIVVIVGFIFCSGQSWASFNQPHLPPHYPNQPIINNMLQPVIDQTDARLFFLKTVFWGLRLVNDASYLSFDDGLIEVKKAIAYDVGVLWYMIATLTQELSSDPERLVDVLLAIPKEDPLHLRMQACAEQITLVRDDVNVLNNQWSTKDYNCRKGSAQQNFKENFNAFYALANNERPDALGIQLIGHVLMALIKESATIPINNVLEPNERCWVVGIKKEMLILRRKDATYDYGTDLLTHAFWDGYNNNSCLWRFKRGLQKIGMFIGQRIYKP